MSANAPPAFAPYFPALTRYFASRESVVLAYLFGSYARGQAGPLSDVDVAVLVDCHLSDEDRFTIRLDIIDGLIDILRRDDVDVLILNEAPLALRYRVVRDGIPLFCREHQVMVAFVSRTVSEYLDFKPIIERHERAILARARKGELLHGYNPHRGALERYRQLRQRLKGTETTDG